MVQGEPTPIFCILLSSPMDINSDTITERVRSDFENAKLATAPIASLVPDILSEIFEHVCSTPASITPDEIMVPALDLSQVCRSWRTHTLTQPSLWSSLSWGRQNKDMLADRRSFPLAPATKRLVRLWDLCISRSRQVLLDISLFLYEKDDAEVRENLLDFVFKEQHRLRSLGLYCREGIIPDGKNYILNAAPKLKDLEIVVSQYDLTRPPVPLDESITVDPSRLGNLQELSLRGNVFIPNRTSIFDSLRLARLWPNRIDVANSPMSHEVALPMTSSAFLSFLQCAPHVHEIEFIIDIATMLPISPSRLVLHNLSKLLLDLNTLGCDVLDILSENLDLPVLETLTLRIYDESDSDVQRWRCRSGAVLKSVKTLILDSNGTGDDMRDPIHNENLRSLLLCTPALECLNICADWIATPTLLLLRLAPRHSAKSLNNLCPKLKKLSLMNVQPGTIVSSQDIVDLISSRFLRTLGGLTEPDPSGLRDVSIHFRLIENENGTILVGRQLEHLEPIYTFIMQGLRLDAMCF